MQFNPDVISYVARTPGALGLIGVSWIAIVTIPCSFRFLKNVKVLALSRDSLASMENSYKPFQAYCLSDYTPDTRI